MRGVQYGDGAGTGVGYEGGVRRYERAYRMRAVWGRGYRGWYGGYSVVVQCGFAVVDKGNRFHPVSTVCPRVFSDVFSR